MAERVDNLSHYSRKDLNTMLEYVDPVTKVKGIKDIDLFLGDIEYLFSCTPTAFNLRNYCILRRKIPRDDFYKRLEPPEYYEELLGFTPIKRKMQTYVHIHAAGRGFYDTDEEYDSYSDFLGKLEYPSTLKKYIKMQKRNLVDIYNRDVVDSYTWVVKNIENMIKKRHSYKSGFREILNEYYLKTKSQNTLVEIGYKGRLDCSKKLSLAVEFLGV